MNVRKFYNGTWDVTVRLVWPVTPAQFQSYVRRTMKTPSYECAGPFTAICHRRPHDIIIGFKSWEGSDRDLGDLVHELYHATHGILDDCGMTPNDETEEAYAYTINSFFDESLKLMKRKK